MKKIFFFAVVVAVMGVFVVLHSCQSSKVFKFNLEKGKGYDYEIVWDMETNVMDQRSKINIGGLYSMSVTKDSAGIKSLSTVYKDLRMDINVPGLSINIQSNKPVNVSIDSSNILQQMMGKMFSGIIDKPFIIKVDEEGNVLEVSGFDALVNNMVDSLGIDEDQKATVLASMKGEFNDDEIRKQFAPVFTIFPNKEVKAGDSWEKAYSVGGKIPAKFVTTYTAKKIEDNRVTMTAKTKISTDNSGEMKISGDQSGDLIVDSKTGLMINADFTQNIEVETNGVKVILTGKGKIKGTAK